MTDIPKISKLAFLFNLLTHFHLQWCLASLAMAGICVLLANWICFAAFMYLALLFALPLYPYRKTIKTNASRKNKSVRILQANVLTVNRRTDLIEKAIKETQADILCFQEFAGSIFDSLEAKNCLVNYKHAIVVPNPDHSSQIALFSRFPIAQSHIEYTHGNLDPTIVAQLEHSDDTTFIVATMHPRPPFSPSYLARQINHLRRTAEIIAGSKGPVILTGDLNSSPWSPQYKSFLLSSNLLDSRIGKGLNLTWPSRLPWLNIPISAIPIDHVLVSQDIQVDDLSVGPHIGSDHLPIVADLTVCS